jgi:hypothetical protein
VTRWKPSGRELQSAGPIHECPVEGTRLPFRCGAGDLTRILGLRGSFRSPTPSFPREIRFAPDNYTAGQLRRWLRIKHGFCIFVGDVHQPLHATSRFNSAEPKGDEGGNDVNISAPCPATTRQNCTRSKNGSVHGEREHANVAQSTIMPARPIGRYLLTIPHMLSTGTMRSAATLNGR